MVKMLMALVVFASMAVGLSAECEYTYRNKCLWTHPDTKTAVFVTFRVFGGSGSMARGTLEGWVLDQHGDEDSGWTYDIISTQGMSFYSVKLRYVLSYEGKNP